MNANKTAIVTGAARGIGLGIARLLLAKNWQVVAFDQDGADSQAVNTLGNLQPDSLLFVEGDVSAEDSVKHCIAQALDFGGQIHALVNNAGIANPESGAVEKLDIKDWQRWIDVDLTGPFLMAKHSIPHLRKSRGAIINIASTRALQSEANCEAYAAAKGGLVSLTHALAISVGEQVSVNAISPGWINTDENAELSEEDHQQHPAGRVGRPADIASLVNYLLSEDAQFISGQNFVVDGGMTKKMIYV